MLRGATVRLYHNPPVAAFVPLFQRLVADGCNAVSIVVSHYCSLVPGTPNLTQSPFNPPWFIYPDHGQDPSHPYANTPEPETVYDICLAARRAGLHVLLKPHIDSYQADWRGNISVKSHAVDWAWAYKWRFLARYLRIAEEAVTDLSLGCELYTATKELGAAFWIDLAAWARNQGFTGPLTYSSNWGWDGDAEYRRLALLWPHLDYIGVDAYFPLAAAPALSPDVLTLVAGWHRRGIEADWCPRIDDDLIALSQQAKRPLVFTEIGLSNYSRAVEAPGADPPADAVRDDGLPARYATAFHQRWDAVPEFAGYYWWEAGTETTAPISHNVLDRPAEAVVWAPPEGATS